MPVSHHPGVRFGVTVASNFTRAGLSFLTGLIVARGLGADGYGDLNFLLGSFAAVASLLEMGTSSAFYTFISARARGPRLFGLYAGWLALQFLVMVAVLGLLLPERLLEGIWLGHERPIVLLAFAASFLTTQAWTAVMQLGEAIRKTVLVQMLFTLQAAVHLGLIAAAWWLQWLAVSTVMWLLVAEYAMLVAVLGPRLVRANLAGRPASRDGLQSLVGEFATYCAPLVLYGVVGFVYAFADRWILQRFGGAREQGFFAIGQQFAAVCLLATTSVLRVFWKEVAEARDRGEHERAGALYRSLSQGLYFVGAVVSCLLIPYSREIIGWTVGVAYDAAWPSLALMFFFPIHQSLGQLSGTFFYATGDTSRYARIGLLMMGLSLPVTYFALASPSATVPGLGLGAVGLAAKMVILQLIGVSVQAAAITGSRAWLQEYGQQAATLVLLLGLAAAGKWLVAPLLGLAGSLGGLAVVAVLYVIGASVIVWTMPGLAGLRREQVRFAMAGAVRRVRPLSA